jgi:hypothetical protein
MNINDIMNQIIAFEIYLTPALAAISFYLIPLVIGTGIISALNLIAARKAILKKRSEVNETEEDYEAEIQVKEPTKPIPGVFTPLFKAFIYFIYGSLTLYGIAFISSFLAGLNILGDLTFIDIYTYIAYGLTVIGLFLIAIDLALKTFMMEAYDPIYKDFRKNTIKNIFIIIGCVVLSTMVWGIWKINSPTYATLNWDIYHHQGLANLIQQNNFHLMTSKVSDTFQFDGYSTLFHVLIATPQTIFNVDILEFWWFVEYFHLVSAVIASFLVGYAFSNRVKVGLISAVFGAFIFEASGAYTSLFLIPQNLAAIVSAVFISYLIHSKRLEIERLVSVPTVLFTLFILLNHLIIGLLGVSILMVTMVYIWLNRRFNTKWVQIAFIAVTLIVMVAFPLVTGRMDFDSINRGEAAFFNYTYGQKYDLMKDVYGYSLLIFLPLGIVYSLYKRSIYLTLLVVIVLGMLTLTISPVPYMLKLYAFGRFFVHAILAMGVWMLAKNLGRPLYWPFLILLTFSLAVVFTTNTVKYKQVPTYANLATHVSPHEIEAAYFLRENYLGRNGVMLLADPATMHILEGLSSINTPGGAYTNVATRRIISDVYYVRDSETMTNELYQVRDLLTEEKPDLILLAINGRFKRWQEANDERKYGIHWNVWTPRDLTMGMLEAYDFVDFIKNLNGFEEVYRNDGIVIFEVRERHELTSVFYPIWYSSYNNY